MREDCRANDLSQILQVKLFVYLDGESDRDTYSSLRSNVSLSLIVISYSSKIIFVVVVLRDLEVTANLYCNFAYPYWEGSVICNIYLR